MFSGAETPQPRSPVASLLPPGRRPPRGTLGTLFLLPEGYEAGFSLGCFLIPNFGSSCKAPCFEPSDNILVKISLPRGLPPTLSSMLPPAHLSPPETILVKSACCVPQEKCPPLEGREPIWPVHVTVPEARPAPGAEHKLCGHLRSDVNGYRNQACPCALGSFCSHPQWTLPAWRLHGAMTQEEL